MEKIDHSTTENSTTTLNNCSFVDNNEPSLKSLSIPRPLSYNELTQLIPKNTSISEKLKDFKMDKDGSLKIASKDLKDKQKAVLKKVFTQAASKLLEGKNVVGISLPVNIFQPRSVIERCCDLFRLFPHYASQAAQTENSVERVKLITAALVGASQYQMNQLKPFNPILGETFQGDLDENTQIFIEHISHHPAISYYYIVGESWKCWGYFLYNAKIKPNTVIAFAEQWSTLQFSDGNIIKFTWPALEMGNFILGTRKMAIVKNLVVKDTHSHIKSIVKFNVEAKRKAMGLLANWKMNELHGNVYRYDPAKESLMVKKKWYDTLKAFEKMKDLEEELETVKGNWLDHLSFNDKIYWKKSFNDVACIQSPVEEPLPSSYRYREDLVWLSFENEKNAQDWKLMLESQQRKDRKIREEGYKEREKKDKKEKPKKGFMSYFSNK
jgi:hypothetical protein